MTSPPGASPEPNAGTQSPAPGDALGAWEVRRRAAAGVGLVTFQGAVIRALAFAGSIALARLLVPEDFGVLAFGLTLMVFANAISDGGVAAALVRQKEPPTRDDLEAFLAFQLTICVAAAAVTLAVGLPFGEAGLLLAVMVASLPIYAFRVPPTIMLERNLSYGRLVAVEFADNGAFYAWALTTAALGWGPWALATGVVVRSFVGTSVVTRLGDVGLLMPRFAWRRIRQPLKFGIRFQAAGIGFLVREQVINVGTTVIAGLTTLGLWSLATRILSLPFLLYNALWRVSFPAMSRLIALGENAQPILERGIERVAVGTGLLLVPLAASASAIVPVVFGAKWEPAAAAIPWASLGLIVSGPVSVAATGYLYAVGDATTPVRSVVLSSFAYWAVAFSLLPTLDLTALGLGWMAAAFTEAVLLGRAISVRVGVDVSRRLAPPVAIACLAGGTGWAIAMVLGQTLASAAAAAAASEALFIGLLLLVGRATLVDTLATARRVLRAAWPRERWA